MTDFMMKGTLISNKKNSLCNTASLDLQWMGVSAKSPFDFELPIPTPILCIPVTFQLSEEELFNTRGFEVKYDSQFYDINSNNTSVNFNRKFKNLTIKSDKAGSNPIKVH